MVTVQVGFVLLLAQAPPQPLNVDPELGEAVRVTLWLVVNPNEQTFELDTAGPLHLIPAGEDVTEPDAPPLRLVAPEILTLKVCDDVCVGSKLAVTDLAAFIKTLQELDDPEHAPLQPINLDPELEVATKETVVLFS